MAQTTIRCDDPSMQSGDQPWADQPWGYQLYGLRITSNIPRPQANALPTTDWLQRDISITFHEGDPFPTHYGQLSWHTLSENREPNAISETLRAETSAGWHYCLRMQSEGNTVHAVITTSSQPGHCVARALQLDVYWHHSAPRDEVVPTVTTWAFDLALGYAVRICIPANLHGSALALDGRAVALLGHKGAGKSTLTAAMVQAGWPMLTDDHVALWPRSDAAGNTQFWVEPGAPRLRLWPTSLPVVAMQADDLPRLYSFQEKRLLALHSGENGKAAEFQATALPLAAIYLLQDRDSARTQPSVLRLDAKDALYELLLKRFSTTSISPTHSATELSVLAQIAQQLPVARLFRPDGLDTLPQVIHCLRQDLASHDVPR